MGGGAQCGPGGVGSGRRFLRGIGTEAVAFLFLSLVFCPITGNPAPRAREGAGLRSESQGFQWGNRARTQELWVLQGRTKAFTLAGCHLSGAEGRRNEFQIFIRAGGHGSHGRLTKLSRRA